MGPFKELALNLNCNLSVPSQGRVGKGEWDRKRKDERNNNTVIRADLPPGEDVPVPGVAPRPGAEVRVLVERGRGGRHHLGTVQYSTQYNSTVQCSAQWLEHLPRLQKVSGSIPGLGKNFFTFVTSSKLLKSLRGPLSHLSPGVSLINDLVHDSGMPQSELFTSRNQNLVLDKLPNSGFWRYGQFLKWNRVKMAKMA